MSNRTDDFNRADSTTTLGTPSDGGSAWSVLSGTWGISTNRGYNVSGGGQEVAVLESSAADVDVQITLQTFSSNVGLILRATDDSNYILLSIDGTAELYKRVGGSFTLLQGTSVTPLTGETWKLTASGNTVKFYKNGVQQGTDQDVSGIGSDTKHGIRAHNDSTSRLDDFSITDLTSAPTFDTQFARYNYPDRIARRNGPAPLRRGVKHFVPDTTQAAAVDFNFVFPKRARRRVIRRHFPGLILQSEDFGTLTVTLDAVTSAATGIVDVQGTTAANLDAATVAATGAVQDLTFVYPKRSRVRQSKRFTWPIFGFTADTISGVVTSTLDPVTLSSTGTVDVLATLAATLGAATVSATGQVLVQAAASSTLGGVSSSETGQVLVQGTTAQTLAPVTISATGTAPSTEDFGTLAATLGSVTLSALGTVQDYLPGPTRKKYPRQIIDYWFRSSPNVYLGPGPNR